MIGIKLTNSNHIVLIDDEDHQRCIMITWYAKLKKGKLQSICGWNPLTKKHIAIQNFIMCNYGMYDHIDRNPLNNCKDNLRLTNNSQNQANKIKQNGNYTSKYKGVSRHKCGLWIATIAHSYIGLFKSEESAAKAYNRRAIEIYGEFAFLNKIEKG